MHGGCDGAADADDDDDDDGDDDDDCVGEVEMSIVVVMIMALKVVLNCCLSFCQFPHNYELTLHSSVPLKKKGKNT